MRWLVFPAYVAVSICVHVVLVYLWPRSDDFTPPRVVVTVGVSSIESRSAPEVIVQVDAPTRATQSLPPRPQPTEPKKKVEPLPKRELAENTLAKRENKPPADPRATETPPPQKPRLIEPQISRTGPEPVTISRAKGPGTVPSQPRAKASVPETEKKTPMKPREVPPVKETAVLVAQESRPVPATPVDQREKVQKPAEASSRPSVDSRASTGATHVDSLPSKLPANPAPEYPAEALANRIEGRVVLRVLVSAQGTVDAISVHKSSNVSVLDQSALTTVRTWRFHPAMRKGRPVPYEVGIPIDFELANR